MNSLKYQRVIYIFFVFCLARAEAASPLSNFLKELLGKNQQIAQGRTQVQIQTFSTSMLEGKYDFNLEFQTSYDDNNLDSPTAVNFTAGTTKQNQVSLSKIFTTGTSFSLSLVQEEAEQDPTRVAIFGGSRNLFQAYRTLTIAQDLWSNFLGRNDELYLEQAKLSEELASLSLTIQEEETVFQFLNSYALTMQARHNHLIAGRALDRAVKRKKLLAQMFKDGLARDVDFTQAQVSEIISRQQVENARSNLQVQLMTLGNFLHRKVEEEELVAIELPKLKTIFEESLEDNSATLKVLRKRLEIAQKGMEAKDNETAPKLNLSFQYKTNEYDTRSAEAMNGFLSSAHNEKIVALNLIFPLGNTVAQAARDSQRVQLLQLESDYETTRQNLSHDVDYLKQQLNSAQLNLKLAQEAIALNEKAVNQFSRLFKTGRTGLEQVIRAEEEFLNSEKSYFEYLKNRFQLETRILLLSGSLQKGLQEYLK